MHTANCDSIRTLATIDCSECDILLINYNKEIVFASYYEVPQPIKIIRSLSYEYGIVITMCARIKIEEDLFYSVVVFDQGIMLGISDALSENKFVGGKSQKVYSTSKGKIGVSVGRDFLFPQIQNCYLIGAELIIHQTLAGFEKEYYTAVKAHHLFGGRFIGLYSDLAIASFNSIEKYDVGQEIIITKSNSNNNPPISFMKLNRIE